MSVMTSVIPHGRPFTVDDLEGIPDDGNRYELIDGMLHVSPCPVPRHQVVLGELFVRLRAACPPGLLVMMAPMDVQPDRTNSLQPDVLVARPADFGPKNLPVAPLLAVEVLSPSTRLYDLNTKTVAYEKMGVPSYWIVDPSGPRCADRIRARRARAGTCRSRTSRATRSSSATRAVPGHGRPGPPARRAAPAVAGV